VYETTFFAQHRPTWNIIINHIVEQITEPRLIIDLASGPGEPALSLAKRFPEAQVFATDIAPDMIAKCEKLTAGTPNIQCRLASAERLTFIEDASVDVVTISYGLMFMDRPRALAEIRRILKPGGGILIASIFTSLPEIHIAQQVLKDVAPDLAFKPDSNPLDCEQGLENELQTAGFNLIKQSIGQFDYVFPDTFKAFNALMLAVRPTLIRLHLFDSAYNAFLQLAHIRNADEVDHNLISIDSSTNSLTTVGPNVFHVYTACPSSSHLAVASSS